MSIRGSCDRTSDLGVNTRKQKERPLASSLSRTFYRNSQIVILDEPSSSLDPEAENRLFIKLERFCEGKTVIFTSHRLSNIGLSTRILVIENGSIIEDGSQEKLLQNSVRYQQLFSYQAEKYKIL